MSDESLHRLAAEQHALVSRAQALQHVSPAGLRHRIEGGFLEGVHPGVYRIAGAPCTWRQRLKAAELAGGEAATIGFLAAGALWGMPGLLEDTPEIIVPAPRRATTSESRLQPVPCSTCRAWSVPSCSASC